MDLMFVCPNCKQELEADASLANTEIQCPACAHKITIPLPDPSTVKVMNPIASSAAAREEKHFSVPVHDTPTEVLIQKPAPPLEVAAKETEKRLRVKTIRRTDCMELGHDNFDKIVSEFLAKIGQEHIISINTFAYTHLDIGSQKLLTDFGILIVYRG
jgi:DNA-directed RNA polymerase subunit RPC12/RpoP